jgi:hypothetical protein
MPCLSVSGTCPMGACSNSRPQGRDYFKRSEEFFKALFVRKWHLPDGCVFELTPQGRDYYFKRSKEFFKAGVPLPVCLEHQPDVGLSYHDRLAERTKHTVGHCHDVQIGAEGQIQYLVDADDDDAAKIMAKNKFVSPEIHCEVVDTRTGHRFHGPYIVHVAVTPNPVQVTGKPHVLLSKSAVLLDQ